MDGKKIIFIFFLSYFCALLQNSFLVSFSFSNLSINLVFIVFFMYVFFATQEEKIFIAFCGIICGFFSDIFLNHFFGYSMISLPIIGFLIKKAQSMLKEIKEDKYPFIQFLPIFLFFFFIYNLGYEFFNHFADKTIISFYSEINFFYFILWNSIIASLIFLLAKSLTKRNENI